VYDFENKINMAVFPALQGGPHNHQIAALATALLQVQDPSFKVYAQQVKANAAALGKRLMDKCAPVCRCPPRVFPRHRPRERWDAESAEWAMLSSRNPRKATGSTRLYRPG
jgi:hypothetical protein